MVLLAPWLMDRHLFLAKRLSQVLPGSLSLSWALYLGLTGSTLLRTLWMVSVVKTFLVLGPGLLSLSLNMYVER